MDQDSFILLPLRAEILQSNESQKPVKSGEDEMAGFPPGAL